MNVLSVLSIPADTNKPIETIEIERTSHAVRTALGINNNFETCITGDQNIEILADEEGALKTETPYNPRASLLLTELLHKNGYAVLSPKTTPQIYGNIIITGGVDLETETTRSLSNTSEDWIRNYLQENTNH